MTDQQEQGQQEQQQEQQGQPLAPPPAQPPAQELDPEYASFNKWKESQKKENSANGYEALKEKEHTKQEEEKRLEDIRTDVIFDLSFDKQIEKNQSSFSLSADKIREASKGLAGADLVHCLKCTATKDFFNNENNINMLADDEKLYIKSSLLNQHDNNVDSAKAWRILENALHIKNRLDQQGGMRSARTESDLPNMKKYMERVRARPNQKNKE